MTALLLRVLRLDGATLVALAAAFAAASLPTAPAEALGLAAGGTLLVGLLLLLPAVDPIRRVRWDDKPLPRVRLVTAFGTAAGALLLAGPLSGDGPGEAQRLVMLLLVVFLGVLGNVFPSLRRNLYFGVRTPWTIRDERVWERTHRVFGHLLVGLTAVLVGLWPLLNAEAFETVFGVTSVALAVSAILYSWRLARRLTPAS